MRRVHSRGRTPRPAPGRRPARLALLLAGLLAAPCLAEFAPDGIEIDGDQADDAAWPEADWYPDFEPMSDPFGSADDTLCGTSPSPKNDIINYFLANDLEHLYLGMERRTNNGNTSFFFSFDVTGDGPSVGDFIFVFCFGSGAVVTDTHVLEWDPTLLEWVRDTTPPSVDFAVNTGAIQAPFGTIDERGRPGNRLDAGRFAEARILLADIEGFDICAASAVTAEVQTKASCSLSSECKDTTGPFTFSFEPLTVSLALSQPPGCVPAIVAEATAGTRGGPGSVTYQWFLNGVDITGRDPSYPVSSTIVIALADECGPTEVRVVADDGACTAEDSATVDVNRPPVAGVAALSAGACDRTITFDAGASTDCNGAALMHAWDFDGDGRIDSTAASGSYTYAACGPKVVTLVVSDGECLSEPAVSSVHVNEAPLAALAVNPTGCLAIAWGSGSTDCDLLSPSPLYTESLSFELDLGDGGPPVAGADAGTHVLADCGTYVLSLTVTDASGCTSLDSRQVTFDGVLTVE
jgi:hypothetical protein